MSLIRMFTPRPCGIPCVVFIGCIVGALCATIESAVSTERDEALTRLKAQHPGVRVYTVDEQISRVYGRPFSTGETPQASAERFRQLHSTLWGVPVQDLIATGPFADGRHVQPIMFNQDTGQYKFTGLYYTQQRDGVDVFRSRLTLLVRNADDYPLVLASADLRDLGGFRVPRAAIEDRNPSRALTLAKKRYGNDAMITRQKLVIWAGVNNVPEAPTLAEESVVEFGADAWLLLTDAATGRFVYEEHLIHFGEVSGNASGLSTEGIGADQCEAEVSKPLPYLTVTSGTNATFTDVNGDFTLPGGGGNISALLSGQWFSVTNAAGTNSSESVPAVSPANLVFNSTNGSQQARSQVNAYVEANIVRDFALVYNPSYPSLDIGDFTIVVNRTDGFCPGNA